MEALGRATGHNWHAVQKNVKGTRKNSHIQQAIADYLGLTVGQCFGPRAPRYLRPLIECEINKKRTEYERTLKAKYLNNHTVPARRKAVNG